jgi:hypothetical protein
MTLLPPLQVILKDGVGITSLNTVSRQLPSSLPFLTLRPLGRLQQRAPLCHAGDLFSHASASCVRNQLCI